jgi:hypothetical protein
MRKRLIALILCAVLVSAVSVTSVVSARQVDARQSGIYYILAALYKFWQSKMNPTGPFGKNIGQEIYCWVNPDDSSCPGRS